MAEISIRKRYLDVMRVVAMIAVVCNHSWGYFSVDCFYTYAWQPIFYADTLLNTYTRFNVPVFLMISGSLILGLNKYVDIKACLRKAGGVLRLLIIWIPLYIIGHCILTGNFNMIQICKDSIRALMGGYGYYNHLWYLYAALLLYAITPFFAVAFKQNEKLIDYYLILCFVFSICWPLVYHFKNELKPNDYFSLHLMGGYSGYYVLGYKLDKSGWKIKRGFIKYIVIGVVTAGAVIITEKFTGMDTYFQDFMSPGIVLMSLTVFLSLKGYGQRFEQGEKLERLYEFCKPLADKSLGVYLVHFIVRDMATKLMERIPLPEFAYLFVKPIVVLTISIMIVEVLTLNKKIERALITL